MAWVGPEVVLMELVLNHVLAGATKSTSTSYALAVDPPRDVGSPKCWMTRELVTTSPAACGVSLVSKFMRVCERICLCLCVYLYVCVCVCVFLYRCVSKSMLLFACMRV